MPSCDRHYYETIQEGTPCHLYFDIEFEKGLNDGINGEELISIFKEYVIERLKEFWNETCDVIDLDSTSSTKFSRHLIFRMAGKYITIYKGYLLIIYTWVHLLKLFSMI
jgi:hypothetical protein